MTQYSDQLRQGNAFFGKQAAWNTPSPLSGMPTSTSPYDTENRGVPHSQDFIYQMGTPSTALATGVFYSASGTATVGVSTLTSTGPLVTASVATFDVPRGVRVTASINLSTTTFTVVGTDGYGQNLNSAWVGPTGDVIGNVGSYTDSLVAYKTITTISINTATGTGTTLLQIGNNNMFGLPYVLGNLGMGQDFYINGSSATIPGTWAAAFTPTGTPTASTGDVRGTITAATTVLANGTRYFTACYVTPNVNQTVNNDDKLRSFGANPFGN